MGLINIILEEDDIKNQEILFKLLKESSEELDEVVKSIALKIDDNRIKK